MVGGIIIKIFNDAIKVEDRNKDTQWRFMKYYSNLRPCIGDTIWWQSYRGYLTSGYVADYKIGGCYPCDYEYIPIIKKARENGCLAVGDKVEVNDE